MTSVFASDLIILNDLLDNEKNKKTFLILRPAENNAMIVAQLWGIGSPRRKIKRIEENIE